MNATETTPLLRIITPNTTAEEVAAIVAVISAIRTASTDPAPKSAWADPARRLRTPLVMVRGAWRLHGR